MFTARTIVCLQVNARIPSQTYWDVSRTYCRGSQPGVSVLPGVSEANAGVSDSFPGSNTKIRNLVPRNVCRRFEFWSSTMEVSAINHWRTGIGPRNEVGNPWLIVTTRRRITIPNCHRAGGVPTSSRLLPSFIWVWRRQPNLFADQPVASSPRRLPPEHVRDSGVRTDVAAAETASPMIFDNFAPSVNFY